MTTTLSPQLRPTAEPTARASDGNLSRSVWLAVACVALIQGGGWVVKALFLTSTARPPLHALSDLPQTIGPWSGSDLQVDSAFANVGAIDHNERRYANSAGAVVFVHRAAWTSQDDWTPHTPELCYTNNGWELLQSETTTLPDAPAVHLVIQHYQQGRSEWPWPIGTSCKRELTSTETARANCIGRCGDAANGRPWSKRCCKPTRLATPKEGCSTLPGEFTSAIVSSKSETCNTAPGNAAGPSRTAAPRSRRMASR